MKNLVVIWALFVAWPVLAQDGNWHVLEETNAMDGKKEVYLMLFAQNEVAGLFSPFTPVLGIKCSNGQTGVGVTGTGMLTFSGNVRVKFDNAAVAREFWNMGSGGGGLISPHAITLARKLTKTKIFLFEFSPVNHAKVVVTFDVRGLDKHLGKVAAACGWKLE
ncbi:MAG: hypothetical protein HY234_01410 [Acidobacteria bacterium]|nr:hypothetical protein [Acidobacteriota bacterium]